MLFPEKIIKLYTVETDSDINEILENYTVAYIKQYITSRLTILIVVFLTDKMESSFQIELLKASISYVVKPFTYRAKSFFNQYLNENVITNNII